MNELKTEEAKVAGTAAHLTLHATTGDLQAAAAFIAGRAVHSGPGAEVKSTGAGKSRRKRRYQVEIDGEVREVSSLQEAQEVIEDAREQAEATAKLAVERAAKAKKRSAHDIRKDARKALQPPVIESRSFPKIADQINAEIERIYQSAVDSIEIALLLRKAEQDEEDDEELFLLL